MKVIIFEGPDRVGKTTVAEALAKKLDTEVFMTNSRACFTNKSINDSSAIAYFNYTIASYVNGLIENGLAEKPIIIYRSFLSEMVYSLLLERSTNAELNYKTDELFCNMDATIVYMENDQTENFLDDTMDDKLILESKKLYNMFLKQITTPYIKINTTEQNVEKYVDEIIQHTGLKIDVKC